MIIGYARVSTTEQKFGLRHDDLKPKFDASVDYTEVRYSLRVEAGSGQRVSGQIPGPRPDSGRFGGELVRQHLQLLALVLREPDVLRIVPLGVDPDEAVDNADPALACDRDARFGEEPVHELADAADAFLADHPEDVTLGDLADLQTTGIWTRIHDQRPAIVAKIVGGFQIWRHVRELHTEALSKT